MINGVNRVWKSVFLLGLWACEFSFTESQDITESIESLEPSQVNLGALEDDNAWVERLNDHSIAFRVEWGLLEPLKEGGPWRRWLQVHYPDMQDWPIEVHENGRWVKVGYTSAQGVWIDSNLDRPARYKVADYVQTPWLPARKDLVFDLSLCENPNRRWNVYRFVIPAGQWMAQTCDLEIHAVQLLDQGKIVVSLGSGIRVFSTME